MNTTKPLVSVLIVNYRAYEEVRQCLSSLARFAGGDIEVVVVDHETEPAKADALSSAFPWICLERIAENPGFAAGVNRAARHATGRYLLLLNPDCTFETDACRGLAKWLDGQPGVGAVGPRILDPDGSTQASARRFPDMSTAFGGRTSLLTRVMPRNRLSRRNLLTTDEVKQPITVDWVSGACMMVRAAAFRAVRGMDEGFFMYWEDADFCLRLKQQGWQTAYHPLFEVTHSCGASSAHARRRSLVAFHRSAYRYYRKHGGAAGRVLAPIAFVGLQTRLALKLARLAISDR
jgi:N-acetylglucosaminyl-diphospho-decaprenol L-rhamnosyltransferase